MIDFNFTSELLTNTFPSGNMYNTVNNSYNIFLSSNIMLLNPKMVPIIKMKGTESTAKLPAEELLYCWESAFRTRTLNKLKLGEIIRTAPYLMRTTIGSNYFYVGKGFIASGNPATNYMRPIMAVVIDDVLSTTIADMVLLVDIGYKEEPVIVRGVIQDLINEFTGDIIYTGHIDKHLSGKIKLPAFSSIRAKKEFTEAFLDECVAAL